MIPGKTFLIIFTEAMNRVPNVAHTHILLAYMMFEEINIFLAKMLISGFLDTREKIPFPKPNWGGGGG